jgi:starch synthase
MNNPGLRNEMGEAGRKHVVKNFDYRVVAKRFVEIVQEKLGID